MLCNRRLLPQGEVEIVDARPAEHGIGRACIPKCVSSRNSVTRDIEIAVQPIRDRAAELGITARYYIGASAVASGHGGPGCGEGQREAVPEGGNSAHGPAANQFLFDARAGTQEFMTWAEREIEHIAYDETRAGVEARQRFFRGYIVRVLNAGGGTQAPIQPGGQGRDIGHELGKTVARQQGPALLETLLELHLQRMIGRGSDIY